MKWPKLFLGIWEGLYNNHFSSNVKLYIVQNVNCFVSLAVRNLDGMEGLEGKKNFGKLRHIASQQVKDCLHKVTGLALLLTHGTWLSLARHVFTAHP